MLVFIGTNNIIRSMFLELALSYSIQKKKKKELVTVWDLLHVAAT
jgi:hypothetical protein